VPAPISTRICSLCAGDVAVLLQQQTEVESSVGLAALVRAAICAFGAGLVTALLEQDPEIARGGSVTALVGLTVGSLGSGDITALLEQLSQPERAIDRSLIIRWPICASGDASQTFDHRPPRSLIPSQSSRFALTLAVRARIGELSE
jgi:hypothetical protein